MSWPGSHLCVHPCICPLIFSRLHDKVPIFDLILLKLVQIVCIIVKTNPVVNEENLSNIMGIGTISNFG